MTERMIVLGTGYATAIRCFNTCFALQKDEQYFLVDTGGGNGILAALEKNHIPAGKIHDIFISHEHSDHILGIVWMLRVIGTKINQGKYEGNLNVYCHEDLVETIKTITALTVQKKFTKYFDSRIIFHPLKNGDQKKILDYDVTFFDICSTKAKQFGFTTRLSGGKKYTFLGDEPYSEKVYDFVKGSDWMLHEAFCLDRDCDIFKPYQKNHSTAKNAAELAAELGVKSLVLWHTEDRDLDMRKQLYTEEAAEYFNGDIYVPDDNEIIELD